MKYLVPAVVLFVLASPVFGIPAASSAVAKGGKTSASDKKPSATDSASAAKGDASGAGNSTAGGRNGVSDAQIANAVSAWMNDTGKVSNFLNMATSFSGDEFTRQATIALNAEKDELNHKAVLDEALGDMTSLQSPNDTLVTQGAFQAVVDALQSMVDQGPDTAQSQVDAINKNRCVSVLPNIDAYFSVAGSSTASAIRATGCLEVDGSAASATATGSADASSTSSADKSTTSAKNAAGTPNATAGGKEAASSTSASQKESGDSAGATSVESPTTTAVTSSSTATAAKKSSRVSTVGSRSAAASSKTSSKTGAAKGAKTTTAA